MNDLLSFEKIILANGYTKKGFGFTRTANDITHWVTVFKETNEMNTNGLKSVQLYAYFKDDINSEEYVYNTQVVSISTEELETLIKIFKRHDHA